MTRGFEGVIKLLKAKKEIDNTDDIGDTGDIDNTDETDNIDVNFRRDIDANYKLAEKANKVLV